MGKQSFSEYLISKYLNQFASRAAFFIRQHKSQLFPTYASTQCSGKVTSVKYRWIECEWSKELVFKFVLKTAVHCKLTVKTSSVSNIETTLYITFYGKVSIEKDKEFIEILDVFQTNTKDILFEYPLDNYLIPDTRKKTLEEYAEMILREYCPAFLSGEAIFPKTLADSMGLEIVDFCTFEKENIRAKIVFSQTSMRLFNEDLKKEGLYDVAPKTVLLNHKMMDKDGRKNTTIFHECAHWGLHRQAMAFRTLLNSDTSYSCACDTGEDKQTWAIEYQATKIAPMLQYPLEVLKKEIAAIYGPNKTIPEVMKEIRDKHKSSYLSLKLQMRELGFDVDGYYNWNNNRLSPNLYIPKGILDNGEFYQIDLAKALEVYDSNETFKHLLDSGRFVYVDDIFILNDKKYISLGQDRLYHLSDYAKTHLTECCIKFKITRSADGKAVYVYYQQACDYLNASNEKSPTSITVTAPNSTGAVHNIIEVTKLVDRINRASSFSDFVKERMQELHIRQMDMSGYLGTERGIEYILKNNGKLGLDNIIMTKICVALQLPPDASHALFDLTVVYWPTKDTPEDKACMSLLSYAYTMDPAGVNDAYLQLKEYFRVHG